MRIPILSGIYADSTGDFRTSLPRNMVPVPVQTGINDGYMRPADGIVASRHEDRRDQDLHRRLMGYGLGMLLALQPEGVGVDPQRPH